MGKGQLLLAFFCALKALYRHLRKLPLTGVLELGAIGWSQEGLGPPAHRFAQQTVVSNGSA